LNLDQFELDFLYFSTNLALVNAVNAVNA